MAHEHLHLKDEIALEHTHGKQIRVSIALLGTLAGGVLLLNYYLAGVIYGERDGFQAELMAMLGAVLLGGPIIWHALKCLLHRHAHMDELVALAILAAFVAQEYVTAGIIAFFMLLSELIETRTALGARASIESLVKLTPTKANLSKKMALSRKLK